MMTYLIFTSYAAASEVVIGGLFDLSGPTSRVGKPYFMGVRDYFSYFNARSEHYKIRFKFYDTGYKPELARRYAKQLIDEGAVAIIGWGTGSSLEIKPIVQKYRIPYLPASFCQELLNPPDNDYIFLTAFSYADEINTIIKFISRSPEYRSKPVAIITNPTKFGTEPIPRVLNYAIEKNVNIVMVHELPLKPRDRDMSTLSKKLQDLQPQIIIVHSTPGPFVKVIRLLSNIPSYTPTAIFGTFYTFTDDIIPRIPASLVKKVFTINHFALWYESTPGVNLMRYFSKRKYGEPIQNVYYIEGGVNAMLVTRALDRIAGKPTGEKIKNVFEKLKNISTGGITPPVSFSDNDHIAVDKLRILRIDPRRKMFVPVTQWISP